MSLISSLVLRFFGNEPASACFTKGAGFDQPKESTTMSTVTSSWRKRRQAARARRDLDAALRRSTSPAMRDELLTIAAAGQFGGLTR